MAISLPKKQAPAILLNALPTFWIAVLMINPAIPLWELVSTLEPALEVMPRYVTTLSVIFATQTISARCASPPLIALTRLKFATHLELASKSVTQPSLITHQVLAWPQAPFALRTCANSALLTHLAVKKGTPALKQLLTTACLMLHVHRMNATTLPMELMAAPKLMLFAPKTINVRK
jgi:hypothetical protein